MPLAQASARRQPVYHGHHHVHHDDVGQPLVHGVQRLGAVAHGFDLVALEAQDPDEGIAQSPVVLGDQHVARRGGIAHGRDHTGHRQDGRKNRPAPSYRPSCRSPPEPLPGRPTMAATLADRHRTHTRQRSHAMKKQLGLAAIGLAGLTAGAGAGLVLTGGSGGRLGPDLRHDRAVHPVDRVRADRPGTGRDRREPGSRAFSRPWSRTARSRRPRPTP